MNKMRTKTAIPSQAVSARSQKVLEKSAANLKKEGLQRH